MARVSKNKTVGQSDNGRKRVTKTRQPHGGALNSGGTPGNRGGLGGTPKSFAYWCRDLVESDEAREQFKAIIRDKDHAQWLGAMKLALAYANGYGLPVQRVEAKDTTPQRQMTGDEAVTLLLEAARKIKGLQPEAQAAVLRRLQLLTDGTPDAVTD